MTWATSWAIFFKTLYELKKLCTVCTDPALLRFNVCDPLPGQTSSIESLQACKLQAKQKNMLLVILIVSWQYDIYGSSFGHFVRATRR
jgi:hypothetical protein